MTGNSRYSQGGVAFDTRRRARLAFIRSLARIKHIDIFGGIFDRNGGYKSRVRAFLRTY